MELSLQRELLLMTWELALRGNSHGLGKVQTQSWGHDGIPWKHRDGEDQGPRNLLGKGLDLLLCEHGLLDTLGLTGRACEVCEIPSSRVMKGTAAHGPIQHRTSGQGRGDF